MPVTDLSRIFKAYDVRGIYGDDLDGDTAEAVGRHYGARAGGGLLDGWLVHTGDTADVPGVEVRAVPLLMNDVPATAAMARAALDLCGAPVG